MPAASSTSRRPWRRLKATPPTFDFKSWARSRALVSIGQLQDRRADPRFERPIADRLSDYHGIVAAPGARFDAQQLLRACNLTVWPFDRLIASQATLQPFAQAQTESPVIDLSDGFEAYLADRRKAGSKRITQLQRKARRLEREVGPVRLEMHVADPTILDWVVRWKSEQCHRTNVYDYFRDEPAVRLVRDIANTKVNGFEGMVSVLYVGDSIAAVHMGMRSDHVLHWWFPTYEHALGAGADPSKSNRSVGYEALR